MFGTLVGTCVGDLCNEDAGLSIYLLEPPGASARMKPQLSTKAVNLSLRKCCISQELLTCCWNKHTCVAPWNLISNYIVLYSVLWHTKKCDVTDKKCDRLWKLTTLFGMLNDFIGEFYTPLEHLVVDKFVSFLVGYCAMSLDDWCLIFWGQWWSHLYGSNDMSFGIWYKEKGYQYMVCGGKVKLCMTGNFYSWTSMGTILVYHYLYKNISY